MVGWNNHDEEVDIRKPLPYMDSVAEFVFCEHCVEHVAPSEGWHFFNECLRILQPGGVLRIAVPSIELVYEDGNAKYFDWLKKAGFGDGTRKSAVANLIVNHGHKTLWSVGLLQTCLLAAGFAEVCEERVDTSVYPELLRIHGHGKAIGEENNEMETIVVEATK